MDSQLTQNDLQQAHQLLNDYAPAQTAFSALDSHDGEVSAAFADLWAAQNGVTAFGPNKSIWQVAKAELRNELCGEAGFRTKMQDYLKKPGDAATLTGIIIYVVGLTTLPLDPAMATIVVLYLLKFGLNVFCTYTEPEDA
ncbi:MAG: hypothetical protein AAF728_10185 [Cyanobacteria bacterium P01_D01_bin.128]